MVTCETCRDARTKKNPESAARTRELLDAVGGVPEYAIAEIIAIVEESEEAALRAWLIVEKQDEIIEENLGPQAVLDTEEGL
jgi:hypothetical protein